MASDKPFAKQGSLIESAPRSLQKRMDRSDDNDCLMSGKKLRGVEDELEDRISSLPDSILIHILSFLPMKEAIKTVLLRRFGKLWTSVQSLEFDGRSNNKFSKARLSPWFMDFVHCVLLNLECATINKFSLKFGSYLYFSPNDIIPEWHKKPLDPRSVFMVDAWILEAIRKKVKVLDLGILAHSSASNRFDYDLPDAVLTCGSLTELKLVNIGLREQELVRMRSLKTLSLTTIMLSDEMMVQMLSGCLLLENLSIIQCYGLHKLNCTSSGLRNVTVVLGEYKLERLELSGPNLSSLHISGLKGHMDLKNLSSLVEATLDLYFGGIPVGDYCDVGILLEKLHHANFFTIGNWCILVLSLWELKNVPCPSSSRKCMVLNTMLSKWHLPGIASLLRNSPNLKMLTLHVEAVRLAVYAGEGLCLGISGIHEESYWNDERWLEAYDFDGENYWNSQKPFSCLTNHLKTIKIFGCIFNPYLVQLVKFLLGSSVVLEKMVISSHTNLHSHSFSKELQEFSQTISSFAKASDRAVIVLS